MADLYKSTDGKSFWPDANPAPVPDPIPEPEIPAPPVMPEPQLTEHYHKADVTFNMRMAGSSEPVQNAPMVQPLVIVPYVSQMQPLYQYTPEGMRAAYENGTYMPQATGSYMPYPYGGGYQSYPTQQAAPSYASAASLPAAAPADEDFFDFPAAAPADEFDGFDFSEDGYETKAKKEKAVKEKKSRANGTAIAGMIFGLIAIAFLVISYFNFLPEAILSILYIIRGKSIIALVMEDLIGMFSGTIEILPLVEVGAFVLSALFVVITFLTNLFSVAAKRYPAAGSIFAWLAFLFAVAGTVIALVTEKSEVNYGAYILVGLTAIVMIISLIRKRA